MKHWNEPFPAIFFKCHVNTCKVCFPIKRFVSMSSIHELLSKVCLIWVKITKKCSKQPVLNSWFDVSKLQKQLQIVIQIDLDQFANFGPLILIVCMTVNHNVAFNSINRENDTKCIKSRQTHKWNNETNLCKQSLQNFM